MPTGAAAKQAAQESKSTNDKEITEKGEGSVAGNLTKDPELRYTDNGRPVCNLNIACSQRTKDPKTGEWQDGRTYYYEVQCWGNLAENCVTHLSKGDRVVAEGRWQERAWTDNGGKHQARTYLNARDLGPSMMFRGAQPVPRPERTNGLWLTAHAI